MSPLLLSRADAARLLGLSPAAFDKLARAGEIPSVKLREKSERLYKRADLEAYVEGLGAVSAEAKQEA